MSQTMQSIDMSDQYGRTPLINYLIGKEVEIKNAKSDLEKLWDRYFYKQDTLSHGEVVPGQIYINYEPIPLRKMYTTDQDVVQYKVAEDAFNLLIDDTIQDIKRMVAHGADLFVQDQDGKTIVEYCYTKKIYETLVDLGAPASFNAWCYFNPDAVRFIGFMAVQSVIINMVILYAVSKKKLKQWILCVIN
jgi:hypothetical protein